MNRNAPAAARAFAIAALALTAACTDRTPTGVAAGPPGEEVVTRIACTVSVAEGQVRCEDPGPAGGASAAIILGGQGTYVRLQSAHAGYDAHAEVFSLDVTVQNLLSQPMGTPDGTTVTGVKVFFAEGPEATAGAGTVSVENPDGTGSFTGMDQPYHEYAQILEPRGASNPKRWRFGVPGSVQRFRFVVYVRTELPAEQGVLRWLREEGPVADPIAHVRAVWGASSSDVFAVGLHGRILHYDGSRWTAQLSERSAHLLGVWGTSRSDVYAVGDSGTVLHYDGNRWTRLQGGVSERYLKAVWGRGDTLYVAGHQRDATQKLLGLVMRSTDGGETWDEQITAAPAGNRLLWGVYGGEAGRVYVTGLQVNSATNVNEAVILTTTDGGSTWTERIVAESTHRQLNRVWAHGQHVFAAGGAYNSVLGRWEGLVMRSADGGASWTQTIVPQTTFLPGVWGFSPTDVTVVGAGGAILHYDGNGWQDAGIAGTDLLQAVWGSSSSDLWAAGDNETFARNTGSGWTRVPGQEVWTNNYAAVWGPSDGELYVVSRQYDAISGSWGCSLLHRTAQGWSTVRPWQSGLELTGIWGTGSGTVIVTGHRYNDEALRREGVILRYGGGGWTETVSAGGTIRNLNSVHGDGAGNIWIVGYGTGAGAGSSQDALVLHSANDGLAWAETAISLPGYQPRLHDVWASGPGDVHAVGTAYSATTGFHSLRLRFDGSAWTPVVEDSAATLHTIWGVGGTIVAAGYTGDIPAQGRKGLILTSTDGGATFGRTTFESAGGFRDFYASWGASRSSMYVAGVGGGIMHFDGTRWEEVDVLAGGVVSGLWGFSASDVYAVGGRGLVLHGVR